MRSYLAWLGWTIGILLLAYAVYSLIRGFVAVARPYAPRRRIWVETFPPFVLIILFIAAAVTATVISFVADSPLAFLFAFDLLMLSASLLLRGTVRRGGSKLSL